VAIAAVRDREPLLRFGFRPLTGLLTRGHREPPHPHVACGKLHPMQYGPFTVSYVRNGHVREQCTTSLITHPVQRGAERRVVREHAAYVAARDEPRHPDPHRDEREHNEHPDNAGDDLVTTVSAIS